ncbi:hypothetical protein [Agrobacterium tumefaciens]|uniref:hypothetical protein n=1 Tax=Agrobacterium tumefaciens TaxID=358 RepID=UPI000DD04026|nr:hypothetical protein FY128_24725 [Agrobacterium tumefaciens]
MKCPAILLLLAASAWFLSTITHLAQGNTELANDLFTMGGSTLILLAVIVLLRNSEFCIVSFREKQEQDPSSHSSISPARGELLGRPDFEKPRAEVNEDCTQETNVTGYWSGGIICLALVLGSVLGLLASSQNLAAIFTALAGIAGVTAGVWFKT